MPLGWDPIGLSRRVPGITKSTKISHPPLVSRRLAGGTSVPFLLGGEGLFFSSDQLQSRAAPSQLGFLLRSRTEHRRHRRVALAATEVGSTARPLC